MSVTSPPQVTPAVEPLSSPPSGYSGGPPQGVPNRKLLALVDSAAAILILVAIAFIGRNRISQRTKIQNTIAEAPGGILRLKEPPKRLSLAESSAPRLSGQQVFSLTIVHNH